MRQQIKILNGSKMLATEEVLISRDIKGKDVVAVIQNNNLAGFTETDIEVLYLHYRNQQGNLLV